MKKQLFSLVMMLALVIVAGSAMAVNETNVLPGGTYTYTLKGVYSDNVASATVTYSTGVSTILQIGTSFSIPAKTSSIVSFTVKYGTQDVPATTGKILVVISDAANCSNSIELNITVLPTPIYTLTIAKDVTGYSDCQARSGVGNNTADALGTDILAEKNTFTYTVTPNVQNVSGNFTYSYALDLPSNAVLKSFNNGSGSVGAYSAGVVTYTGVSAVAIDVFTITFNSTTGIAAQTLPASLTIGAASTLVPVDGGGTYQSIMATGGSLSQSVTVKAVPTIGKFE